MRRRLRTKTTLNERPAAGVPTTKKAPKSKAKGATKHKPRGDPDQPLPVKAPEPKKAPVPRSASSRSKRKRTTKNSEPHTGGSDEPSGSDSEVKKAKTALEKVHEKLRDKTELWKLHLKHYHMSLQNFKRRTSALQIPKDIYDLYESVVTECPSCQKHAPAPQ